MNLLKYNEIWNESWRYFRRYAEKIPLSDDDWVEAIRMMSEFVDRHPENEAFARKLIIMVMRELETQDKEARPARRSASPGARCVRARSRGLRR